MTLHLTLLSDATFGRGDGVAGLVDAEVQHDPATGLPFLHGRTLKGLLVEACDGLLYPLRRAGHPALPRLDAAGRFLFGTPGSGLDTAAALHVGHAHLPAALRRTVAGEVRAGRLGPADVLESLTAVRRQTAVDPTTGAPLDGSLRATRVLLRDTPLVATLDADAPPPDDALALLAGTAAALRRAGTGRNRGRGRLRAHLRDGGDDLSARGLALLRDLLSA